VGVHVVVGEHADLLELLAGQQVGLVDDQHAGLGLLGLFGGEQLGGLGDQGGLVVAGLLAEVAGDLGVEAVGADEGVGQVDDGVADGVQGMGGGAGGDGLAGADLAGGHADGVFADEPGDAGDRLGVAVVLMEHGWGEVAAEWGPREAVVGAQTLDHRDILSVLVGWVTVVASSLVPWPLVGSMPASSAWPPGRPL
jgi:hypothetical protein